ncbi:hypothetical protein QOT17_017506 [Balamuthia mandrillaris]
MAALPTTPTSTATATVSCVGEEEEEEEDKGRGGGQAEGEPKHLQKPQQGAAKQKGWADLRQEEVDQLPEALRTVRSKRKDVWRFLLTLERSKWEQFEALLAKHGRLLSRQEWLKEMVRVLGASPEVAAYCHDNHQIFSDGCLAMEEARQMYFDRVWWSIPPKKTKQKKQSRRNRSAKARLE